MSVPDPARGSSRFDQMMAEVLPDLVQELLATEPKQLYRSVINRVERPLIALALQVTGGNQVQAARLLGINRNTLRKRLRTLYPRGLPVRGRQVTSGRR